MEHSLKYSVLLSVYAKVQPEHLDACLDSVFTQSYPPDEVVLVCDGALTDALDRVVERYSQRYGETFKPVRLPNNVGTGRAANVGIQNCRNELIVKTDSDDISRPYRCDVQVSMFEEDPELVMAGGYIQEFDSDSGEPIAVKRVPLTHEDILAYARRRNPINNPTIAIKKSFAQGIGGFNGDVRCEDYDFVCRMLMAGAKSANSSEVLLDYRVTHDNYRRRRDWNNTKSFVRVRWLNLRRGFCSLTDFLVPCLMQLVLFVLPQSLTGTLYRRFLRR